MSAGTVHAMQRDHYHVGAVCDLRACDGGVSRLQVVRDHGEGGGTGSRIVGV